MKQGFESNQVTGQHYDYTHFVQCQRSFYNSYNQTKARRGTQLFTIVPMLQYMYTRDEAIDTSKANTLYKHFKLVSFSDYHALLAKRQSGTLGSIS